jgi:L-asparagine oxygenase
MAFTMPSMSDTGAPGRSTHGAHAPYGQLRDDEVVSFRSAELTPFWQKLTALRAETGSRGADDDVVEVASIASRALPDVLHRYAHRLRSNRVRRDVLLVRGFRPPSVVLPATPATSRSARQESADLYATGLLAAMNLLGEPFTFATLHEGRLVQDVVPVLGEERAQTSEGSDVFLDWHVEDAFTPDRCDYLGLLCLRGDAQAVTVFASMGDLHLDDQLDSLLRQPRFALQPDAAHGVTEKGTRPTPAITGTSALPQLCFDAIYLAPLDPADAEAARAIADFRDLLTAHAVGHVLEPGDLLILDNRRVAHARTSFTPRHDGSDRWLLRAMVCSSLRRHQQRGAVRVIPTTSRQVPVGATDAEARSG